MVSNPGLLRRYFSLYPAKPWAVGGEDITFSVPVVVMNPADRDIMRVPCKYDILEMADPILKRDMRFWMTALDEETVKIWVGKESVRPMRQPRHSIHVCDFDMDEIRNTVSKVVIHYYDRNIKGKWT